LGPDAETVIKEYISKTYKERKKRRKTIRKEGRQKISGRKGNERRSDKRE
jgi:vacuolar-type H+-ATPase subunit H